MTGFLFIVVAIVVVAAVVGLVLALRSGKPKYESLGAPAEPHDDPLIRTDSRRNDTPAGADLDRPGGREHGQAP